MSRSSGGVSPVGVTRRGVAVLLAVVWLLVAAPAASAQTVEIDPPSAHPGDAIQISGSGFQPFEPVVVEFLGRSLVASESDAEGFVTLTPTIPADAYPGTHPMTVSSESAVIELMYEVLQAQEQPAASPTVVTEQDADGAEQDGDGAEQDGEGAEQGPAAEAVSRSADEDGAGVPWWMWVLIALVVVAGLVMLAGARIRGQGGSQYADRCPAINKVRNSAGVRFVADGELKLTMSRPCIWGLNTRRITRSFNALHQCTLQSDHAGDHVYEETASGREPPSPDEFYEELPGDLIHLSFEDPNCGKPKEEVKARILARYNQRVFAGTDGEGIPPPLGPGVCASCGKSRSQTPCEHCLATWGWDPNPDDLLPETPLPQPR